MPLRWTFHAALGIRRFCSVTGSKWHSDGWQKQIHGRPLVYFGERHEEPAILEAQVAMLRYWIKTIQKPTALVLEIFTKDQQFILDRWRREEPGVLQQQYLDSGGDFELSHYMPLLDEAFEGGMSLVAGFPKRDAARRILQEPFGDEVKEMTKVHALLGADVEDYFRIFAALISAAPVTQYECGELPQRGRKIFPAQCWKDLECAKIVASLLQTHCVMVVAGSGHTDFGLGIPCRVRALSTHSTQEVIVTARARGEAFSSTFRKHNLSDVLITYEPAT